MLLQSKRSFKYNCRHYKYDIICMAKEPYKFTIFTYYYRKKKLYQRRQCLYDDYFNLQPLNVTDHKNQFERYTRKQFVNSGLSI